MQSSYEVHVFRHGADGQLARSTVIATATDESARRAAVSMIQTAAGSLALHLVRDRIGKLRQITSLAEFGQIPDGYVDDLPEVDYLTKAP